MLILAVMLTVKPEFTRQYQKTILAHAANCLAVEPGCVAFAVHTSAEQPDTFFLYETYQDENAFTSHRESAHLKIFKETIAPWVVTTKATLWTPTGP